jgi:hypothetical protein
MLATVLSRLSLATNMLEDQQQCLQTVPRAIPLLPGSEPKTENSAARRFSKWATMGQALPPIAVRTKKVHNTKKTRGSAPSPLFDICATAQ